jgi:hypothetical protein
MTTPRSATSRLNVLRVHSVHQMAHDFAGAFPEDVQDEESHCEPRDRVSPAESKRNPDKSDQSPEGRNRIQPMNGWPPLASSQN